MNLLTFLAMTGFALKCSASVLPGNQVPEFENDGINSTGIVAWPNKQNFIGTTQVACATRRPKVTKIKAGDSIQIDSPWSGNMHKCLWKLKGVDVDYVRISCSMFYLAPPNKKNKCRKDFLQIRKTKYCGYNGPYNFMVDVKNVAKIRFKSKPGTGLFSCIVTADSDNKTTTPKPTEKPSTCKCGQKNVATRIVNGKETDVLEYPWQAGLVDTGRDRTWCGGSLINSNWVLTAAHCTDWIDNITTIQVLLAEHDVTVSESHTERFNVKQIINHPKYGPNPWVSGHDIALIELDGRVNFETSEARPICLPTGQDDYAGKTVTLTGFGQTAWYQPQSNFLREVDIGVISNTQCSWYYGGSESDYNTMICAGEPDGTGGCMGDSGGPLIIKEGTHYEQVGVVSFGSQYCNSYGVFARVTDFTGWINNYASTGNPDICSP